jgi:hypothetical protein
LRNLLIETTRLAKKRFPRQALRVWFVMLGQNAWRAYVLNVRSKVLLCDSELAETAEDAISALKLKIEKTGRKIV